MPAGYLGDFSMTEHTIHHLWWTSSCASEEGGKSTALQEQKTPTSLVLELSELWHV